MQFNRLIGTNGLIELNQTDQIDAESSTSTGLLHALVNQYFAHYFERLTQKLFWRLF